MNRWLSPLRYPGGKARMTPWLADLFWSQLGPMDVEVWIEPFAGGAGAALSAVRDHDVPEAWLVERNPALAAFWRTVLSDGERLAQQVESMVPTMSDFESSRDLVMEAIAADVLVPDPFEVGLAAFLLNRCSRSGMIASSVGPIGGKNQSGRYLLTDRWNGPALAQRIRAVAQLSNRITLHEGDGIAYLESLPGSGIEDEVFCFVDPPYIEQGNVLYAKGFDRAAHERLAAALRDADLPWLLTYDAHPDVLDLYTGHAIIEYEIPHTANTNRIGVEYAVCSPYLSMPQPANPLGSRGWRWAR